MLITYKLKYKIVFANTTYQFSDQKDPFFELSSNDKQFEKYNTLFTSKIISKKIECVGSDDQECDFYIFLVPIKDLCNSSFYYTLSTSNYRAKYPSEDYKPKPIIFISVLNVFNKFNNTIEDNVEIPKDKFNIDKRYGFLDSSIWHLYVPIKGYPNFNDDHGDEDFEFRLIRAIIDIKENIDSQLFKATVSQENLEFQVRLMQNSYLADLGGDHSKHINPFIFHSEVEMFEKSKNKIDEIVESLKGAKIKWNVLLIDDYACVKLKKGKNQNIGKSKKDVIETVFNEITKKSDNKLIFETKGTGNNRSGITILDKAKKLIEENNPKTKYDIILLDYLLDDNTISSRELGSDVFTNNKYSCIVKQTGPLGKAWVLPISSYNKAMLDRITNKGINRVTNEYYLFDGADAVSTPELFKYNLLCLMELQLNQAVVSKEEIVDDLLNSGFTNTNTRLKARGMYGSFMHKFGLKEYLKLDNEKGSAFAISINDLLEEESYKQASEFYEYVGKALYLIGFGTYHDKIVVWELLKTIKKLLPIDKETNEYYEKEKLDIFFNELTQYLNE